MTEFKIYTHRQRAELEELFSTFGDVWPEFIFHDEIARIYIGHTDTDLLPGGESQRIKMVHHLSSSLVDVMYIFDEPSIGLHPRDVHRLN